MSTQVINYNGNNNGLPKLVLPYRGEQTLGNEHEANMRRLVTWANNLLPPNPGTGQVLTATGPGSLEWSSASGGGGTNIDVPPNGTKAQTWSRFGVNDGAYGAGNGDANFAACNIESGVPISFFNWQAGSGGTAIAHSWCALLDNNYNLLAVTADNPSGTTIAANTILNWPVSAIASGPAGSFTTAYSGVYYLGLCLQGSGFPKPVAVDMTDDVTDAYISAPPAITVQEAFMTTPPSFPFTLTPSNYPSIFPYIWAT